MNVRKIMFLMLLITTFCIHDAFAVDVQIVMNNTSKTMTLMNKANETTIDVGQPDGNKYSFSADPGTYVLTGYDTENVMNGTIEIAIDEESNVFNIFTAQVYATNSGWVYGDDYEIGLEVLSREGVAIPTTIGSLNNSTRKTFLISNGYTYIATFIPAATHCDEGYMSTFKTGTVSGNVTVTAAIPMGYEYNVTVDGDYNFFLGYKIKHFVPFSKVEPTSIELNGDVKTYKYILADKQVYNYRAYQDNQLTYAGYFTMNPDPTKVPELSFSATSTSVQDAKKINHSVKDNAGYETGDIFLNINAKGFIQMDVNDTKDVLAMRTWELTDNTTNNYFIEPSFHYTVINLNGEIDNSVVRFDKYTTDVDPWVKMTAVGNGTAIVLVTYDAINLNKYSSQNKESFLGGEFWGAIWPENTGVYVVNVGNAASGVEPNMTINELYNQNTKKVSGAFVDAEHDVFYYLDNEEGFTYSFTPTGVTDVEIAYPIIGEQMTTYNGFSSTGVSCEDGTYSVLLKNGRNIIRMKDANDNYVYQVLTAKECHRDITNLNRGGDVFYPGDYVKIQYSGLRHPANKLAGIYNMSASVLYNGTPSDETLILGSGQYNFGSSESAQSVTVQISPEWDVNSNPDFVLNEGVIQVTGFGDPIGNHRITTKALGRNPNFTAISHKTYFGQLPDVSLQMADFDNSNLPANGWDGQSMSEPSLVDGVYQIGTGAELAWLSNEVNVNKNYTIDAKLLNEIDLCDFNWTPIGGNTAATAYQGSFDGNGYGIKNLFVYSSKTYQGLFGYINNATIKNLTVDGSVSSTANYTAGVAAYSKNSTISKCVNNAVINGKQYVSGITSYASGQTVISCCENHSNITASSALAAGITSYLESANGVVTDCFNSGNISATGTLASLVAQVNNANGTVKNNLNIGNVNSSAATTGNVYVGTADRPNITNNYVLNHYAKGQNLEMVVSPDQLASGEIAHKLGDAWGQTIGTDSLPVIGGMKVYKGLDAYTNSNVADYSDQYTLAILTFEDEDVKPGFENLSGASNWSELIDSPQYGGPLLYGESGMGDFEQYYSWTDGGNTFLHSELGEGWGSYCFWSGGHAISHYGSSEIEKYGDYTSQLTVYNKNAEGMATSGCGHNGSDNFAVHNGYSDNSGFSLSDESLPSLTFGDGVARVIDHMYVNSTNYLLTCICHGNSLTSSIEDNDWVKIVATGYNGDETTSTAEFYLCKGKNLTDNNEIFYVSDWTKFDLSELGLVTKVVFNILGSSDNGYGFSQPAYFAYDDVAVRIPVSGGMTLVDKSVYDNEVAYNVGSLTYTRNFGTTNWQPLYVPFESDYSDWMDKVDIAKINDYENNGNILTVSYLESGDKVEANTHYFIRAKQLGEVSVVVDNTTLVPAENKTVTYGDLTFTGTYSPTTIQPSSSYVLYDGELSRTNNQYALSAMRWFVDSNPSYNAKIVIQFGENDTNVINLVGSDNSGNSVFNIDGTRKQGAGRGLNIIRNTNGTVTKMYIK